MPEAVPPDSSLEVSDLHDVSAAFAAHYAAKLREHGATAAGVDMGSRGEETAEQSYRKALALIRPQHADAAPSLLDVGCGYGALRAFAEGRGRRLDYVGIDIVPEMIDLARAANPDSEFHVGDFLDYDFGVRRFDYVVCAGSILTIRLKASILEMERYARRLIRRMWDLSDVGIAFELMTNRVNFMVDQSYYVSPVEMLAWCLSELSGKVAIDHAYERYAFTTYVYRGA
jgi:SAM-dependent methyltransferase